MGVLESIWFETFRRRRVSLTPTCHPEAIQQASRIEDSDPVGKDLTRGVLPNPPNPQKILATVLNRTVSFLLRCHHPCMQRGKTKKRSGNGIPASLRKEMAKPRMAKSARTAELNLDNARISGQASNTTPRRK
jgi:hypothetical protein